MEPGPGEGGEPYTVFISHAGTDTWVAERIAEKIHERGGETFLDEADIAAGDDFEKRILAALARNDELLLLLTPWALDRSYIWMEGITAYRRRPIVPVLHGLTARDLQASPYVPVLILKRSMVVLNDLDRYFQQLGRRIALRPRV